MIDIPEYLSLKTSTQASFFLLVMVFICFILIAIAKISDQQSVSILQLIQIPVNEKGSKLTSRTDSISNTLLMTTFFLSSIIATYNYCRAIQNFSWNKSFLISFALPFCIFLLEVVALYFIQWLTNESKKIQPAIRYTIIGFHLSGIFLTFLNLFWITNPNIGKNIVYPLIAIFSLNYLTRFIKNSMIVLSNGVPWYYLILYLCTLEILPIFIVFMAYWKYF